MKSPHNPVRDVRRDRIRYQPCSQCGKKFSAPALSGDGLCPRCADPALYALCQKINAEEAKKWRTDPHKPGNVLSKRNRSVAARMAAQIREYNRRNPGEPLTTVAAEALLSDGYTPTARNHKVGGPNAGRSE